eukprot:TRINITY_DN35299_c0_g1_i1.p1 TRINITY_DN35299_c0_g1~~TRINITY_DN35299_c0_g1_i1.p1  ORF type:complete len:334 (-),score=58.48 TRINITY_DN35299_c0_g1_i1:437-1438(-)
MVKKGRDEDRKKQKINIGFIKNKLQRCMLHAKLKHEKKIEKKKRIKARDAAVQRAIELGEEPPKPKPQRTIENTREFDETICRPEDEELSADNAFDEFSSYFNLERIPKILLTSSRIRSSKAYFFMQELLTVFPTAHYYKRGTYDLKKIVEYAKKRDFTAIVVIHVNRGEPDGMLIINLPDGPTAHFKLSSLVMRKDIKHHGKPTNHLPEIILNNFATRLGHRVGRMFQSLFPQHPSFRGRRVITFHNQRDFIFFRHHRYIFETKEVKEEQAKAQKDKEQVQKEKVIARLQECGPRFTLKLLSLQHGTFDTKHGEYEWVHKPDMDTSRRRFFL